MSDPAELPPGLQLRKLPLASARRFHPEASPFHIAYRDRGEAAVAQPFRGITSDGAVVPGLFPIQKTGVSTQPLLDAAQAWLAALGAEQRAQAVFPLESDVWRRWSNIHPWTMRHGVCLEDLTPEQRARALGLLRATLSEPGFRTARDVMRLNDFVRMLTGKADEYAEWWYFVSILGTPSSDAPWGWQIDGHHLNLNCFVLGNQLVLTPSFMGSEPVAVQTGPYAGTRVFEAEEQQGLALMQALGADQRGQALISTELPRDVFASAFRDNLTLKYEGIEFAKLSGVQQDRIVALVELYVGRMREGHDRIRMEEVKRHLGELHFAWIGGADERSAFYYRLHSPVILIEFDHQAGIVYDNDAPLRHHIHTVVRTPNGNDYGRDLLRQHHARFDHAHGDPAHRHS